MMEEGRYWSTREKAEKVLSERPDRESLCVRRVMIFVDDVEEVNGEIIEYPRKGHQSAYLIGASSRTSSDRFPTLWYSTLRDALKKREKYRGDDRYYDWVIEENRLQKSEYQAYVHSCTSSGEGD